ncbi:SpoIIE family protein phosphatase [bacterium]|nr:SpoIIE family protein phosphatase [bacterium]
MTLEGGSRLRSVSGDPRARGEAARLTRITAAALAGSQADLAVRLVPGRGAFFEIDESGKPAPGGRSELVLLVALAQLDEGQRLEAATRAAFRALARTTTGAQALALALEEALGTELLGRTLPAAVLRLDTRLCELKVATAGLGPLFLRRAGGEVTSASGVGPALGSGTAAAGVVERAVAWNPGDLVLLTAPRAVSYGAAPWLTGTAGLGASATLERLFADAATAPPSPDNVGGAIALEWTRPAATSWQA